ncbi:bifunctional 4-hydroxy-2-oxoglutarate aldolase/2-dehydro-3-deoxy-phosphogluconate aldolase [Sciscionella sediminilitoris]|uniref:bifunctional 4-hydroxy-2-oxoglutarate aldolase/2-dehydro-3-deoxy-phosphogluconate aldolase n=1 Tax=Sciscionella sediminilitoris TaxID=1445613 RepID=UPI0004DEE87C|nr:bifunctional 4-hydroxy-2-oxoglutarate aldolase/2-dehydro-3-deoxy-phosphogluconate aldolase [Sciscionella sp. SE31]
MDSPLDIAPVIPVAVFTDPEQAVGAARALVEGGVRVIEVTLRTEAALESVRRIAAEVGELTVGAGTITAPEQAAAAVEAGAAFLVTPGTTDTVLDAVLATGVPTLPGAATVSEAMRLAERGFTELKFFPAAASGGPDYLRAINGPLPGLRFCPTGGIRPATAGEYLELPNVGCIGGTWLTPADALAAGDYARITQLAAESTQLHTS